MTDSSPLDFFDYAPTAAWVEDFGAVRESLAERGFLEPERGEPTRGEETSNQAAKRLEELAAQPDLLAELTGQIVVVRVNQAAVRVFEALDEEELTAHAGRTWGREGPELFVRLIQHLAEGETHIRFVCQPRTLRGRSLHGTLSINVLPGFEQSWSRIAFSFEDQTEAHNNTETLKRAAARSEALLALPKLAEQVPEAEFFAQVLAYAEDLTGSRVSFLHAVDEPSGEIELLAWSKRTLEVYCTANHLRHYPVAQAGVWAESIRERRTVVINDYASDRRRKGLPQGHAAMNRLISLPVIENDEIVLVVGVGNKSADYVDDDVETLEILASSAWQLARRNRLIRSLETSKRKAADVEALTRLGSWRWLAEGNLVIASDEFYRLYGCERTGAGMAFDMLAARVHPDDQEWVLNHFWQSANLAEPLLLLHRVIDEEGELRWIEMRCVFDTDEDGHVVGATGSAQDVTERVEIHSQLQLAAAVFHSTTEGVCITDADATIVDVNRAFTEITGYERDEVLGKNPRILQSGRHDAAFYERMWQALTSGGVWRGEVWNRRRDGQAYPELLTISSISDEYGKRTGYVGVFTDITEVTEAREHLERLAHHDPLTGLPNRLLLAARLEQSIRQAQREDTCVAAVFIDLDGFKRVNDSLGHQVGDALLVETANRLRDTVREVDTVARLSGDEFVVLFEGLARSSQTTSLVQRLVQKFSAPFVVLGHELRSTASVGVAIYPHDATDADSLLRNADAAMYQAKEEGRNTWRFYTRKLTSDALEHVRLSNALHRALERNEFQLVYQPQVDLTSGQLTGFETLLRWTNAELGMVSPARFIPVAESSGLIVSIGLWVLRRACVQARDWLDRGLEFGRVAVNVSGVQLRDPDFFRLVERALEDAGLPGDRLELELTESFVMDRDRGSRSDLLALRDLGIELAIDDFGTGYSSLSYLKSLPIHRLKIDRAFVKDLPDDEHDLAIAEAILALGRALDLGVIAEGVETESQAKALLQRGCEQAQGYLYGKPMSPEALEEWLDRHASETRGW